MAPPHRPPNVRGSARFSRSRDELAGGAGMSSPRPPLWQRAEERRVRLRLRTDRLWRTIPPLLAVCSAVTFGWQYVFQVGARGQEALLFADEAIVVAYALCLAGHLLLSAYPFATVRHAPLGHAIALVALGILLADILVPGPPIAALPARTTVATLTKAYLVATGAYALWTAGVARFHLSPSLGLALSFVALIGAGTGLLLNPGATPALAPLSFVDALFTATSAACVTGLAVRDTGTGFTFFGQGVILGLIQIGGLGIMTFAAFFASAFGRGMSLRDQLMIRDVLQADEIGRLPRVLAFILISTLTLETLGAGALYALDASAPLPGARLWSAAFHAISAFCNAGFGLYPESLGRFERAPAVLAVVAALIVLGGFGYIVLFDFYRGLGRAIAAMTGRGGGARAGRAPGGRAGAARPILSLQSRLVLLVSSALVVAGAAVLLFYDWESKAYVGLDATDKVANAVFLSVSCRTAGFNVAPIAAFTAGSLFVMMALMFIGGSPGSTAGGIKTTTFAVLTARIIGLLRHREEIEVFGRTLPRRLIANAIGVAFIQFGMIFVVTCAVLYTDPQYRLQQTLFEVVSAFGTVGLSTGITPDLSAAGKLFISGAMFAGRIGPLTLILAMAEHAGTQPIYRYPEGKVMIG